MKILAIGDIIGSPGRTYLKENLASIKQKYQIDFTIANGENTAGGVGIDLRCATELFDAGANVITLGNHTWRKKDVIKILDDPRVVRPINYLEGTKGEGCRIINFNNKKIAPRHQAPLQERPRALCQLRRDAHLQPRPTGKPRLHLHHRDRHRKTLRRRRTAYRRLLLPLPRSRTRV